MHLFLSPRHQSTRQKARGERVGDKFYLSRWLDDVVYNNYIGYMAVEAQGSVNETSKYLSKTDFIFSIHQGERNLWRLVKQRYGLIGDAALIRALE
jgi:hypothetical protein